MAVPVGEPSVQEYGKKLQVLTGDVAPEDLMEHFDIRDVPTNESA